MEWIDPFFIFIYFNIFVIKRIKWGYTLTAKI